ncbi:MAG: dihydropteroate synthase [Pseudomonadales bacterium]
MSSALLQCGGRLLDLSYPQIMGVLNVTPDSFSDGGALHEQGWLSLDKALVHTEHMLEEGAAIVDVGGESTRPGAEPVSLQEEMDRVLPVVEAINSRFETIISVDTSRPELMLAAAEIGAGLLNDVRALECPGALTAAVQTGLPVCLVHMQGRPETMQHAPSYQQVIIEVGDYLLDRAKHCIAAGIDQSKILLDPGFGFGKRVEHNLALLNRLPAMLKLGFPVLVGLSRKSLIGRVLECELDQRLVGSLALAVLAADRGASIIRAHDVAQTVDAVKLCIAVKREQLSSR